MSGGILMRTKMKMLLASSLLAVGTIGTITAFAATGSTKSENNTSTIQQNQQHSYQIAKPSELAQILGIDVSTLKADIAKGQTLVEIAQTQSISEQTLISDLESNLKTHLDEAVQSGKLTSVKEQQFLNKFETHMQQFVEHPMKTGLNRKINKGWGLKVTNLTNVLGIDKVTLITDLKNGESLVQIAETKGISEQTLENDLLSTAKNQLDQAVTAGKLTSTQEQQMLLKLQTRIASLVNQHRGDKSTNNQQPSQSL